MNAATNLIHEPYILSEINASDVLDSIVLSSINDSEISIVGTLVEGMPLEAQNNVEVQKIIAQIDHVEKGYLPLVQDLYHSGLFNDPERYILLAMLVLLIVGGVFYYSPLIAALLLLVAIAALVFYLVVRRRAIGILKSEINTMRQELLDQMSRLQSLLQTGVASEGEYAS